MPKKKNSETPTIEEGPFRPTAIAPRPPSRGVHDLLAEDEFGLGDILREGIASFSRKRMSGDEVEVVSFGDIPDPVPEEEDENVLVKGGWLERGGAAMVVSTAGTGKSIFASQLAVSFGGGRPFCGLVPKHALKTWMVQTEDSPRRLAIDRNDICAALKADQRLRGEAVLEWRGIAKENVRLVDVKGRMGDALISALDRALEAAEFRPDVLILNPLLDFIDGDVNQQADVAPFLIRLRALARRWKLALVVIHHCPKPPKNTQEYMAWLRSPMPEYLAAGSSYLTNWARSIITLLKIPGKSGFICVTAGKNSAGLDWAEIANAKRRFLAWGSEDSCGGHYSAHYWRTPSAAEETDLVAAVSSASDAAVMDARANAIAAFVQRQGHAVQRKSIAADPEIGKYMSGHAHAAWQHFAAHLEAFGCVSRVISGRRFFAATEEQLEAVEGMIG